MTSIGLPQEKVANIQLYLREDDKVMTAQALARAICRNRQKDVDRRADIPHPSPPL